jgi:hypothetical protein
LCYNTTSPNKGKAMKFVNLNTRYKLAAAVMGILGATVITGALTIATVGITQNNQYRNAIKQEAQWWRGADREVKWDTETQHKLDKVIKVCNGFSFSISVLGDSRDAGVNKEFMVGMAHAMPTGGLKDSKTEAVVITISKLIINYAYDHPLLSGDHLGTRAMVNCLDNFSTSYTFDSKDHMKPEDGIELLTNMNK